MNVFIFNVFIFNVILVYGVWVDGLTWLKVILLFVCKGLIVIVVQFLLIGFEVDVVVVQCVIVLVEGEVVLVGYSYVGVVIGEVGNDLKVVCMVYIDVFVLDVGELVGMLFVIFEVVLFNDEICLDVQGYLKFICDGIFNLFVQDLDEVEKVIVYVMQGLLYVFVFGGMFIQVVWCIWLIYYFIGNQDYVIFCVEQECMVVCMNVIVVYVDSSYVLMLLQLQVVVDFIVLVVV